VVLPEGADPGEIMRRRVACGEDLVARAALETGPAASSTAAWVTPGPADGLDPTRDLRVPDDPDPHAEYRTAWTSPSPEFERSSWWQRPWCNR
jgi:hypothetical protein